jgi:predicted nuclease with RNAse H fold
VTEPVRALGVDVGGRRKGFDVAIVDERRLLDLRGGLDRSAVVAIVEDVRPAIIGIDGPRSCAPEGDSARACERQLARAICGIRWTPDERRVSADAYYEWVVEALALFDALTARGVQAIEVFPTASWTCWCGPRGTRSRSSWTREGLASLPLEGVPQRTNQDQRDAIAAALTARQHASGQSEAIGEIVVPRSRQRGGRLDRGAVGATHRSHRDRTRRRAQP